MRGVKPSVKPASNAVAKAPRVPGWMSKEAQAEWRRVMPSLIERRILTDADLGSLESYCVAAGRVKQLEVSLRKEIDPRLCRLQDAAMKTARQLAAELGLTPVSRNRPAVREEQEQNSVSPLDW